MVGPTAPHITLCDELIPKAKGEVCFVLYGSRPRL